VEDAASGDAAYNSTRPDDVGGFLTVGLGRVVEPEGVIKSLTVRDLISGCTGGSCENAEMKNRILVLKIVLFFRERRKSNFSL
jgi:hypothetical protein